MRPLHLVLFADICKLLLEAGADQTVGLRGKSVTPLEMACRRGHLNAVTALVNGLHSSDIATRSKVLPAAVTSRNMDICKAVLMGCEDTSAVVNSSRYLRGALLNARPEVFVFLREAGYEFPLWAAACAGDLKAMRQALARGEGVNAYADVYSGITALHAAIMKSQMNAAQFLLSANADASLPMKNGTGTALHLAADQNDVALIKILLESGADINIQEQGVTPVYKAARRGRVQAVETLVEAGAALNIRPKKYAHVPLHERVSDKPLARYLKKHGSR